MIDDRQVDYFLVLWPSVLSVKCFEIQFCWPDTAILLPKSNNCKMPLKNVLILKNIRAM